MGETQCIVDMPNTINDVLTILDANKKHVKLIAGGTDLIIDMKNGVYCPEHIISLSRVNELKNIEETKQGLSIGTTVTANELASNIIVNNWLPALSEAAFSMASNQIRNIATIGGNICSAVPSADLVPPLMAADASISLRNKKSERLVKLQDFFLGPRKTVMKDDELATHIIIPKQPKKSGTSYMKFKMREANALAVASVAARLVLRNGKINDAKLVLGAVAPTPVFSNAAMKKLLNKKPSHKLFEDVSELTYVECKPISDVRCCADFRRNIVQALTIRALNQALSRARGA